MHAKNRMQKIRLETQNGLPGRVAKDDTVGSIEHEVKNLRRDLLLLVQELKEP